MSTEEAVASLGTTTLLALVLPIIIAAALYLLRKNAKTTSTITIPGKPGGQFPLIGDTLRLLHPKTMGSYQVSSRKEWKSPVWRTSVLFQQCVFVSGASHMKQLSKEERSKKNTVACFPPHHRALFGEHSVLVTSGAEHGKLRGAISPALQPQFYRHEIEMAVSAFVEGCKRHCSDGYFPLVPELKQFTLRVMLRVVLGEQRWQEWMVDSSKGTVKESVLLSNMIADFSIWSKGILSSPTTSIPFTAAYKAMAARNRIRQVLLQIIREERDLLEKEKDEFGNINFSSDIKNSSMIRMLLRTPMPGIEIDDYGSDDTKNKPSTSYLSEDAIVDNILTLAFAGTDTTASILTSSFLVLSKNEEVRKRLQSCIAAEGDSETNSEDLKPDDILLAFLSEVQRMYPAAPFTMRSIEKRSGNCQVGETEGIDMGETFGSIPPGFLVTYAIAGTLQDDAETYPSPHQFDLNRWLKKSNDKEHSSVPPVWAFGGGFRMCPGRFLSNAEASALLRRVLSKENGLVWNLKEDQDLEYAYTPGFFPKDGLLVRIV